MILYLGSSTDQFIDGSIGVREMINMFQIGNIGHQSVQCNEF